MGTAVSVGATFMSPACVRHCVAPFFIRACGHRRQRRGDIHVARERALLCCVCVRNVRSVAFVPPAWVRCCTACASGTSGPWPCAARVGAVVSRRCLSLRSCTGRHKWRPYRVCRRACVVARRFFIRACGNRQQRRGDIHVARVRAPLCPAVFSFVRVGTAVSVGETFMSPASVRHCVPPFFHSYVWKPPAA